MPEHQQLFTVNGEYANKPTCGQSINSHKCCDEKFGLENWYQLDFFFLNVQN